MELTVIQPGRGPNGTPPIFEKIGIVGLGLIGGSIALAARRLWPTSLVIGVDVKDVLETAMRLHAIDVAADDLIVLAEADLVILAAPVRQNLALAIGLQGRFDEAQQIARQELSAEQAEANVAYLRGMLSQQNAWKQLAQNDDNNTN